MPDYFDQDLLRLRERARRAQAEMIVSGRENRSAFDIIREYRRAKRRARREQEARTWENVSRNLRGDACAAWEEVREFMEARMGAEGFLNGRSAKAAACGTSRLSGDARAHLREFYAQSMGVTGADGDAEEKRGRDAPGEPDGPSVLDDGVSVDDVTDVLRVKEEKTAPGPSGLSLRHIKKMVGTYPEFLHLLSAFFSRVFMTASTPREWAVSIIVPVPKPGKTEEELRTDPTSSYRPIALLDVMHRLCMTLLLKSLRGVFDRLSPVQAGFVPGRCCQEQTLFLLEVLKARRAAGRESVVCFVDFKQAYDSVVREELWKECEVIGLDGRVIQLLKSAYFDNESFLAGDGVRFPVRRGVRQGCPISPLLFNVALERVVKAVETESTRLNVASGDRFGTGLVVYADDVAMWAPDLDDLRLLLNALERTATTLGLRDRKSVV